MNELDLGHTVDIYVQKYNALRLNAWPSKKSFSVFWTNFCPQSQKPDPEGYKIVRTTRNSSIQIRVNVVQKCDGQRLSRCRVTVISLSGLDSSSSGQLLRHQPLAGRCHISFSPPEKSARGDI